MKSRSQPRRLTAEELFRVGRDGLEAIGDATLELRLTVEEQRSLRQSDAFYQAAVAEEMLYQPEAAA